MPDIREGNCPHCRHHEIVQSAPVMWAGETAVVLAASHERNRFGGAVPSKPLGALNLFVCRRCGFAQWFAFAPGEIPIGTEFGTRLITGSIDNGPYR